MIDLIALVTEMADECYLGRYDDARVVREVGDPRWDEYRGSKRDWRGYVPDGFKRIWTDLPLNVRLAIFAMACVAVRD